ncbi:MAG: DUF3857 domain-containing protein [Pseudomonadota bacterium]
MNHHRSVIALPLAMMALSAPMAVHAGDEVQYGPAPEWVELTDLSQREAEAQVQVVLLEQQSRIEKGQLWRYQSTAIALDSPQALTQFGTLSAQWLPDKGDLIVHSVNLIRDGEVIDVLADGAEFEVLRREQGLESRLLDGSLTATMNVPGARLGDIVHLTFSVTLNDQAMGENVQWQSPLLAKPFPLEQGRTSISWPADLPVSRVRMGDADVPEPVLQDGYYTWEATLPVAELEEMPSDAPLRYQLGELMQVTTYSDWRDVSRQMAQHYRPADPITPGGELAKTIADIAAQSDDPLTRTALAVRRVQDDVSYLLNGLNGGNYLPQSPEETWEKRYGDCKAKSLLLHVMLRELGVSSEVVLVRISGGDAVPQLAPMPGNFDHMIVRAEIDGVNYWLDGTNAGTRAENLDQIPRFFFALPLRDEGADLMPLDKRAPTSADRKLRLAIDHSAGIRVPALMEVEVEYSGASASQWRTVAEQGEDDIRDRAVRGAIAGVLGEIQLLDEALSFDEATGVATIRARGLQTTQWKADRSVLEYTAPAQAAKDVSFQSDRARAAWRAIPLRLNGPVYFTSDVTVALPDGGEGFELDGKPEATSVIGGVELSSTAALADGGFTLAQTMRSVDEELPADQISQARRALARFDRSLPVVRSPKDIRETWEYFGKDRALLAGLEAFYAQAIEEAEPDNSRVWLNRARFLDGIHDHKAALADVERAFAIESARDTYAFRAALKWETGDLEGALEDYRQAEDLQPDGSTYYVQVELLSLLGDHEEAMFLAKEFGDIVDQPVQEIELQANALGWAGSFDRGLEMLEDLQARRPGDGELLNSICWYVGTWDKMTTDRLNTCVQAVEKSNYSLNAIDSRAMAYFRLERYEEALADLNAVLLDQPAMAASRLLRGVVRVAKGDADGREDIDLALAMQPSLRATYGSWGLNF